MKENFRGKIKKITVRKDEPFNQIMLKNLIDGGILQIKESGDNLVIISGRGLSMEEWKKILSTLGLKGGNHEL